jgi:Ca2+-transporting ATPase
VFAVPIRANPLLLLTVLLAQGIHIAAMYVPGLSTLLGMAPVAPSTWALLLGIALTLLVVDEVAKLLERKLSAPDRPARLRPARAP